MYRYRCHTCSGLCDAGELENGVCYECRMKAAEEEERRQEARSLQVRKEINRKMQAKYAEQPNGQMVLYGTN